MIAASIRGGAIAAALLVLGVAIMWPPQRVFAQDSGSCGAGGGAAGPIALDGDFGDWAGQPCLPDPIGDCQREGLDLAGFFFATADDDPSAYFMAETTQGTNQPLGLQLHIDADNDGVYSSTVDRIIQLRYQPTQRASRVDVDLLDGQGQPIATIASNADWGESRAEGSSRVEWGVSFAQLGIQTGQTLRMYLESQGGNDHGGGWCDSTEEVQWSPADALGTVLLLSIIVVVASLAAYLRKRQA